MDEICADYRKLASIGLNHDQIKDCMVVLWGYTYQEIETAGLIVSSGKNYWVDDSLDARAKKACDNFPEGKSAKDWTGWVDKYCGSKSINSATAQDWDAVRPEADPLSYQVGGDHYTKKKIQPVEYIHANEMDYMDGAIVKYISRWRDKGGVKDLRKIKQFVDLIIKMNKL